MFNATLSDDGAYVILFHEDEEEPEVMEVEAFVAIYGDDIVKKRDDAEKATGASANEATSENHDGDAEYYWKAFRRLVENCGHYAHSVKLKENVEAGTVKAQMVAYKYFSGANADSKLDYEITALNALRLTGVATLDYWSRRVGYKPMSTPQDVKKYSLNKRADTEILLNHLAKPDFRKRIYRRIDKYAKKGELKSPAEVVTEVLLSYKKKTRKPS